MRPNECESERTGQFQAGHGKARAHVRFFYCANREHAGSSRAATRLIAKATTHGIAPSMTGAQQRILHAPTDFAVLTPRTLAFT